MSYNISFEVASAAVLLVMLVFVRLQYSLDTQAGRAFNRLTAWVLAANLADVFSALALDMPCVPDLVCVALNTLYFVLLGVCARSMVLYMRIHSTPGRLSSKVAFLNKAVLVCYLALLAVNIPTGLVFSVQGGVYGHGPLYAVVYAVPLFFVACATSILFVNKQDFGKREMQANVAFGALTVTGIALQALVAPQMLITWLGVALGMLILLFAMETPDYLKMVKAMADLNLLRKNLQAEVDRQTSLARSRQRQVEDMTLQTVKALAQAVDAKDKYTNGHSGRVSEYAVLLAEELGWPQDRVQNLRYASLLHDIGKIGIPDSVLNKPGRLTDEEFEVVKSHTTQGADILSQVTAVPGLSDVARYHHERWDGTGYPSGLSGESIPENARLVAVADAYDAMTSSRVYRPALPPSVVREELERGRGTQFDPAMLDAFLHLLDSGRI